MGKLINIDDLPSERVEWDDIFDAPSIDIVRCKECKYAHLTYDGDCKYCDIWFPDEARYLKGNDFCSYGERRDK